MRPIRRRGFSLIELLAVIAIIAILLALLAGAVIKYLSTGSRLATKTTLLKLEDMVYNQIQASNRQADILFENKSICPPGTTDVNWRNYRRNREFPVSFNDVLTDPNPVPQYVPVATAQIGHVPPKYESAILLYLAMTKGDHAKGVDFSPNEIGEINGVKYFKDGWGQPISFSIGATAGQPMTHPYLISAGEDMTLGTNDDMVRDRYDSSANNIAN